MSCLQGLSNHHLVLCQCKLGKTSLSETSRLVSHRHFELGIVKIQRKTMQQRNHKEKSACTDLLVTPKLNEGNHSDSSGKDED